MTRKRRAKIAFVFGTRPEIIKLSPIIRHLQRQRGSYCLVHTGQHYSYEMDRLFFRELELPDPTYQLSVRSRFPDGHAEHTGRMMTAIESILMKSKPNIVLVQGDTNSVLAGSLVTSKLSEIKLGHVEAGLRSYDRNMPEEINRIISDHVSDFLFVPTASARRTLLKEGVSKDKIFVTGNTIVDAVEQNIQMAKKKVRLEQFLPRGITRFFLMTLHRPGNVDDKEMLSSILKGVRLVIERFKIPVIFPIHPRTLSRLKKFRLSLPKDLHLMKPVGFLSFLRLEDAAEMILTDSGGVQEEACILKIPCVTLRTTTERPETVEVGANIIVGRDPDCILDGAAQMGRRRRDWKNPFGDGYASERIIGVVGQKR